MKSIFTAVLKLIRLQARLLKSLNQLKKQNEIWIIGFQIIPSPLWKVCYFFSLFCFWKSIAVGWGFFFNCIGHRNYKDFQSKITVCVLNKANPEQSGLQRCLVYYIWSSLVSFQGHRKSFFNYQFKIIQIFQLWLLYNHSIR